MAPDWDRGGGLLQGPLLDRKGALPFAVRATLGDLRPRFLPKGSVGRGQRAVARNGRVLLASDRPLAALAGRAALVRFQVWHRVILPGDLPEPYGILVCVRTLRLPCPTSLHQARLTKTPGPPAALALDVGGGLWLEFVEV